MYLLQEVNEEKEIYTLDQVNCMEKPIGIMLQSYNPLYKRMFYLFMKMAQSYNINYYKELEFHNMRTMPRTELIMKREMNIELHSKKEFLNINDFFDFINMNIQNNNPVIVPANLRELYYSKFYLKNDWYHSFFVYDYDKERGLYHIFDSVQRNDDIDYYKFVIPEKTLYDMYQSFNYNLYEESIYYINSEHMPEKIDAYKVMHNFLNRFVYDRVENEYLEIDMIYEIINDKKINQEKINMIRSIYHYKEVLYNELSFFFQEIDYDQSKIKNFNDLKKSLLDNWNSVSCKVIYELYKNNMDGILSLFKKVLDCEKNMFQFCKEIVETFNYDTENNSNKEKLGYRFVNNEDYIISNILENSFQFCFNNNRLYNNWFKDQSPKIIYNNLIPIEADVEMSARFCLHEYEVGSCFLIGFIIKTNMGESYLFGLHAGVSLRLEHTSVNNCILDIPANMDKVQLGVSVINNHLYINFQDGHEKKEVCAIPVNGNVNMVGVCCKTWGEFHPLIVGVEKLEVSVRKNLHK